MLSFLGFQVPNVYILPLSLVIPLTIFDVPTTAIIATVTEIYSNLFIKLYKTDNMQISIIA